MDNYRSLKPPSCRHEQQTKEDFVKKNIMHTVEQAHKELVTKNLEGDNPCLFGCTKTDRLCAGVEAMFLHGLSHPHHPQQDLWKLMCQCSPKDVTDTLRDTHRFSEIARCRAFVKDMLNTPGAPVGINRILTDEKSVRKMLDKLYNKYAFIQDEELRQRVITRLDVLQQLFQIHLRTDHPCLNSWCPIAQDLIHGATTAPTLWEPTLADTKEKAKPKKVKVCVPEVKEEKGEVLDAAINVLQHPAEPTTTEVTPQTQDRPTTFHPAREPKTQDRPTTVHPAREPQTSFTDCDEKAELLRYCTAETEVADDDDDDADCQDEEDHLFVSIYDRVTDDGGDDTSIDSSEQREGNYGRSVMVTLSRGRQPSPVEPFPQTPSSLVKTPQGTTSSSSSSSKDFCRNNVWQGMADMSTAAEVIEQEKREQEGAEDESIWLAQQEWLKQRKRELQHQVQEQQQQQPQQAEVRGASTCEDRTHGNSAKKKWSLREMLQRIVNALRKLVHKMPMDPEEVARLERCRQRFLQNFTRDYTLRVPPQPKDSKTCAVCGEVLATGGSRLCHLSGQRCCRRCHGNRKTFIPYKIIKDFDFRKYPVCDVAYEFLKTSETRVWIEDFRQQPGTRTAFAAYTDRAVCLRSEVVGNYWCMEDCAKALQSKHQSGLASVTPDTIRQIASFSVRELLQVKNKTLIKDLRKTVKAQRKHLRKCPQHQYAEYRPESIGGRLPMKYYSMDNEQLKKEASDIRAYLDANVPFFEGIKKRLEPLLREQVDLLLSKFRNHAERINSLLCDRLECAACS